MLQLCAIAIYSHRGERRVVRFDLGKLNIVTGSSKSGKSSLFDIVDYCWGRDECTVSEGALRKSVSWFAVLWDNDGEGILIARKNPGPSVVSSDEIYYERNVDELPENPFHFTKNTTSEGLRLILSKILGISENIQLADPGTGRIPTVASASQAIFFSIQAQDEIANRRLLFHRQGEQFIPPAIKDTLPYFLGAMEEDYYLKQRRHDAARARLRRLERDFAELKSLTQTSADTAQRLLLDAKRVGLADSGLFAENPTELRGFLAAAAAPRERTYSQPDGPSSDLGDLEQRRRDLRAQLQEIRDELGHFQRIEKDADDFEHEAREQQARLASIGLVKGHTDRSSTCPLCESQLPVAVPQVAEIELSLASLGSQLQSVRRESPRLQKHIAQLEVRRSQIDEALKAVQKDIGTRIADNERLRVEQDVFTEQAHVAGKISYYLENVQLVSDDDGLKLQIARARAEVAELAQALDPETIAEKIATALSLIGRDLTHYARELRLEHSGHPLRLDRKNLTVVADTDLGPLSLPQMGSGENWVGYHVAAHLAIHKLFRTRGRPIPATLMLDQPSQAHYPPDRDLGAISGAEDEDQEAVARLYLLLKEYCENLDGRMQIIVADHVELLNDWFRAATVERWRDGIKFVPGDWITEADSLD